MLVRSRGCYGLDDRGVVAPGHLADLNIIDFDRLALPTPYMSYDLPAGGRRLLQQAKGYVATIKSGQVIFQDGEPKSRFCGHVICGSQAMAAE